MKPSILDTDLLSAYAKEHKLQPFRVKQIYQEIYANQNVDFSEMTTLSKDLRQDLEDKFCVLPFTVDTIVEDDKTTKIGFKTADGHIIEAVIMYHRSNRSLKVESHQVKGQKTDLIDDADLPDLTDFIDLTDWERKLNRITLCVSSQVGCPMNCLFCVTWKLGIKRNLSREEIVGQILYANTYIKQHFGKKEDGTLNGVRNVVFMGMGEPLLNYDNVKKSIEIMLSQQWLSLGRRHITISTAGIIPGIQKLIEDEIPVKLAISLHAPNQELRNKLMPVAKAYPLDELMKTIDDYVAATDNRIFYEYIMIKNITDTPALAKELAQLLRGRLAHVNLIPYNQNPAIDLEESEQKQMRGFKKILEDAGITVTLRASMGRDAKGACGQLGYEKIIKK